MTKANFTEFRDKFIGQQDLADNYGVVATPTISTSGRGVDFNGGDAIHFGNALQIDPTLITEFGAVFKVDEAAGINVANLLYVGLIAGNFNADLTTLAKSALVRIDGSSSLTELRAYAKDGTNSYDVASGRDLKTVENKIQINFARGLKEVVIAINGEPVRGSDGEYFDLSGIAATDVMQPVFSVEGAGANTVTLLEWYWKGRAQKGLTAPPSTSNSDL